MFEDLRDHETYLSGNLMVLEFDFESSSHLILQIFMHQKGGVMKSHQLASWQFVGGSWVTSWESSGDSKHVVFHIYTHVFLKPIATCWKLKNSETILEAEVCKRRRRKSFRHTLHGHIRAPVEYCICKYRSICSALFLFFHANWCQISPTGTNSTVVS